MLRRKVSDMTNVTTLVRLDDMGVPYGEKIYPMEGSLYPASGVGSLQVGNMTLQGAHAESFRQLASIANELADEMEKREVTAPDKVTVNQEQEPAPIS